MFPVHPNQEEESKASQFTALSLSTGVQGSQQSHIPSHVAKQKHPTSFSIACTRHRENPCESQKGLTKIKRQRSLAGPGLTIGTGSSSSKLKMNGADHPMESMRCGGSAAGSGVHAGEYSRNKPRHIVSMSGVGNACEVSAADKASLHHQFVDGFSGKNSNTMRAYERAGSSSGSEVNDANNGFLYHQSVKGFSVDNGKIMSAYSRAGAATFGNTSVSERIHQRMIKNRESAARSRARKQALEAQQQVENMELKKENDILKRVVRFLLAILRTKHMKLPPLSRSFSAPL